MRSRIRKLLVALSAAAIVAGPAIAHADYLPEAYGGCAEIKRDNPHYFKHGHRDHARQMRDYKRCLIETDRALRTSEHK
jgi:hypothetical protein